MDTHSLGHPQEKNIGLPPRYAARKDQPSMIKIEHLVKNYGSNCAVDDISLEIGEGEIVGFLGPNGAGKSTTMNILTGYLSSTAGRVSVAGIDVLGDPLNAKKQIATSPSNLPSTWT